MKDRDKVNMLLVKMKDSTKVEMMVIIYMKDRARVEMMLVKVGVHVVDQDEGYGKGGNNAGVWYTGVWPHSYREFMKPV